MKKGEMWARRIISSLLLLAVLAGLIWLLVWVWGYLSEKMGADDAPQSQSSEAESLEIPTCDPDSLEAKIVAKPTKPEVGEGSELTVTIVNSGAKDCQVEAKDLSVQMIEGDEVIWSPVACTNSWDRTLLLSSKLTWTGKLNWDGKVYSDCEPVAYSDEDDLFADTGMYRVYVRYANEDLPRPLYLEVK